MAQDGLLALWVRALLLMGGDDYVQGNSPFGDKNLKSQPFTASIWVQPHTLSDVATLLYLGSLTGSNYTFELFVTKSATLPIRAVWHRQDGNSHERVEIASGEGLVLPIGSWSHIVVTHNGAEPDPNSTKIYVNGIQVSTRIVSSSWGPYPEGSIMRIGGRYDRSFDGFIDDVRIYNRVLSATEVVELSQEPAALANLISENEQILQELNPGLTESSQILKLDPIALAPFTVSTSFAQFPEEPSFPSCPSIPIDEALAPADPARLNTVSKLFSNLTLQMFKTNEMYDSSAGSIKNTLTIQLGRFAHARKLLLVELMRNDADAALSYISSQQQIFKFPFPENCREIYTTIEGKLQITHADFFEQGTSKTKYTVGTTQNQRIQIHGAENSTRLTVSGIQLKTTGYRLDDDFIFDTKSQTALEIFSSPSIPADASGVQKTVVLMATITSNYDESKDDYYKELTRSIVFGKMKDFYRENSYGKLSDITGDIFPQTGRYKTVGDCSIPLFEIAPALIEAADPVVDFNQYDHLIIVLAPESRCGAWGTIGKATILTDVGEFNMSISLIPGAGIDSVFHEFGHGLGLAHANSFFCTKKVISPYDACSFKEYGDFLSIMGSRRFAHHTAPHKERLGWLDDSNTQTIIQDGAYTVQPTATSQEGIKALKVPRGSDYLYIEYRQPIGFDTVLAPTNPSELKGAILHLGQPGRTDSLLLDGTPLSPNIILGIGDSFADYLTGTTITTSQASEEVLTVDIRLNSVDLKADSVEVYQEDPRVRDIFYFSGTIKNQGQGNVGIETPLRIRADFENPYSGIDSSKEKRHINPLQGGGSGVVDWKKNWEWLGNGLGIAIPWTSIGKISSDATKFAFGFWQGGYLSLRGDRLNYEIQFGNDTCVRGNAPYGHEAPGDCVVISDLATDFLFDHRSFGDYIHCELRYTAATRLIEFQSRFGTTCSFAVFSEVPRKETDWAWLANGGNGQNKTVPWTPIGTVSRDATRFAVGLWTGDLPDGGPVGDQENYSIIFHNGECQAAGLTNGQYPSGCFIIPDLNSDMIVEDGNYPFGSDVYFTYCDFRYTAASRLVEFRREHRFIDCGVAVFEYASSLWKANKEGTHTVEFCADPENIIAESDETNNCVSRSFRLHVNVPPVLNPIGDQIVEAESPLTFVVSASDPNNDTLLWKIKWLPDVNGNGYIDFGDVRRISALLGQTVDTEEEKRADLNKDGVIDILDITMGSTSLPMGAVSNLFSIPTRTFSWIPSSTQRGSYSVTILVSDGTLKGSVSETITITVLPKSISQWKFDETSGTIASDSADNNPGTLVDGPVWTQGKTGGAINFDGVDDFINLSPNENLAMRTGDFTIAGWINLDEVCGPTWNDRVCPIISTRFLNSSDTSDGYYLGIAVSHIFFQIGDGTANNGNFMMPYTYTNSWHHIAAVRDKSTNEFKLYLDGQLTGTNPDTLGDVNNLIAPWIGGRYTFFKGKMDNLRIYNTALSDAEIAILAQQ